MRAKLTEAQLAKLLAYHAQGWTHAQLAARFGIARSSVNGILQRARRAA